MQAYGGWCGRCGLVRGCLRHSGPCDQARTVTTLDMAKIPIDDLLKLPAAERAELAIALWDSLGDGADVLPLTEEQKAELDRRVADHDIDPSTAVPWEEVRRRLRQA